jgi:5-methylcytosine-specific restriction endonuclease McrBC GTP-binding regulatory subunit McrB
LLIEEDKRGDLSVALPYVAVDAASKEADLAPARLTIPPNLILVGLMNTADRSLAVVDYAFADVSRLLILVRDLTTQSLMRIPDEADQGSGMMSITIPG